MKKIFAALLALVSSVAFSATLVPIQLLNPAGSTAGQMLVSTGASSAPTWSNGPLSFTGQSTFTNTSNGAAVIEMTGNGVTTPNKFLGVLNGNFTIYGSSGATQLLAITDSGNANLLGSLTLSQTGGIIGTTTNNNANAGSVGEYLTNTGSSGACGTSGSASNSTSVSLTAGDWDVQAVIGYTAGAGATISTADVGVSTTSGSFGSFGTFSQISGVSITSGIGQVPMVGPMTRISLASTTTVFAVSLAIYSGGTCTNQGFIRARRVR